MRLLTQILLALLIVSLFSAGGVALAQSSNSYDLGCWSVALGGGGERSSSNFRIVDSFGYWAHSGVQSGGTAGLRPGFIWAAPAGSGTTLASAAPALSAASPLDGGVLYLPIVSNYIRVVRTCPW